jgi:redox-sensing transcriptional repressor
MNDWRWGVRRTPLSNKRSSEAELTVTDEIPHIVIGRLPIYLRALTRLAEEGQQKTTSSHELGEQLGISSAQIRKDLSHFGEFGKQGTGYHIEYLVDQLRQILNLHVEWDVAVIGAGHLGHALANYNGFKDRGFRIRWLFDNDPTKVGQKTSGLVVQHIDKLEETIKENKVEVAILAIPPGSAQSVTDRLIKAGIKAILSYAPVHLIVPDGVQVSYSDPVTDLQRMSFYLTPK